VVVRDRVVRGGTVLEDTDDWYAQDTLGAVWYLGEDTREFRGGRVVSTEGSWQAGVAGARAGVMMPAHPAVGESYRQEHRRGVAEDMGRVWSVDDTVTVPAGTSRIASRRRTRHRSSPRCGSTRPTASASAWCARSRWPRAGNGAS
jgi:hypothetical protein